MTRVFISMDLRDSTKTKWKIHRLQASDQDKDVAVEQLIRNMWNQYCRMIQVFINNGFPGENMFLIKSLGDELWLVLEVDATEHNGNVILRTLLPGGGIDAVEGTGNHLLARVMPSSGLRWKITLDVVDQFLDCGKLAFDVVHGRTFGRPHGRKTTGSPFDTTRGEERARLTQCLVACVQIEGNDSKDAFDYRFDPVGWQVDRFHRLKNVCRKHHGDKLVVGQRFMEEFFSAAAQCQPDADGAIRWQADKGIVNWREYEGVAREESFKGFDEPYRYYFVRRIDEANSVVPAGNQS